MVYYGRESAEACRTGITLTGIAISSKIERVKSAAVRDFEGPTRRHREPGRRT